MRGKKVPVGSQRSWIDKRTGQPRYVEKKPDGKWRAVDGPERERPVGYIRETVLRSGHIERMQKQENGTWLRLSIAGVKPRKVRKDKKEKPQKIITQAIRRPQKTKVKKEGLDNRTNPKQLKIHPFDPDRFQMVRVNARTWVEKKKKNETTNNPGTTRINF